MSHIGWAARARGATSKALQRFGESAILFQEAGMLWGVGLPPAPRDARRLGQQLEAARTALGDTGFDAAGQMGSALAVDDAIAEALAVVRSQMDPYPRVEEN